MQQPSGRNAHSKLSLASGKTAYVGRTAIAANDITFTEAELLTLDRGYVAAKSNGTLARVEADAALRLEVSRGW